MSTTLSVNRFFLSYSREQIYFAESVVLALQKANLSVWFDLQKLTPGSDWKAGIDGGLARCNNLILIASRSSLESKNVRYEWEKVLKAGKQIYVVIYEPVTLPAELRNSPRIDLRTSFNKGITRFIDCLQTSTAPNDPVPKPNRLHIVFKVPRPILALELSMIAAAVIAPIMLLLIGKLIFGSFGNGTDVISLASGICALSGLLTLVDFVRHRAGYYQIRAVTLIGIGGSLFAVFIFPIALIVLVIACYAYLVTLNSPDLLRWQSIGRAPLKFRVKISGKFAGQPAQAKIRQGQTCQLHFIPADSRVATSIGAAMETAGFRVLAPNATESADVHLAILSNLVTPQQAEQWVADYQRALTMVVISSVDIPADLEDVARYQWVDYRSRTPAQLKLLAEMLQNPDQPAYEYGLNSSPVSMRRLVLPRGVGLFTVIMRYFGAITLSAVIGGLVLLTQRDSYHYSDMVAIFMVFALLTAVMCFLAVDLVVRRRIGLILATAIVGILGVLWLTYQGFALTAESQATYYQTLTLPEPDNWASMVEAQQSNSAYATNPNYAYTLLSDTPCGGTTDWSAYLYCYAGITKANTDNMNGGFLLGYFLIVLVAGGVLLFNLRRWLPAKRSIGAIRGQSATTLEVFRHRDLLIMDGLWVGIAILYLIFELGATAALTSMIQ